jgi:aromatic ring-opening dioxygenase catalytic subunit (LigB family)
VFAIGVTETFSGPNDDVPMMPHYDVPSRPDFAAHLRSEMVLSGFDIALVQEFEADHSVFVPLHFLTPQMHVPVVPIFVNGHVPPLPPARRCFELGRCARRAIEAWREPLRVVTMGSGSFSLDVHGTRTRPGAASGVPDPQWAERIQRHIERNTIPDLLQESTPQQMRRAGNVAGELLNWIAMLGTAEDQRLRWIKPQPAQGHAYAVWTGAGA